MSDALSELPEELDFYLAGSYEPPAELKSDPLELYGQLVCWCLIQRFWYYVLGTPKATDTEYDMIELAVRELEDIYPTATDHPYSPSKTPGSEFLSDYPPSIHNTFFCEERLGCNVQQYRVRNKAGTPASGASSC